MDLTNLCAKCNNYFENNKVHGNFTIKNGNIEPNSFLKEGQYFRIINSTFNDGVYQFPASSLIDEEFVGAVWSMRVPPAFIDLCSNINEYESDHKPTDLTSESIGGYSYSRGTNKNGQPLTWQDVFSTDLKKWRKL